MAKEAVKRKKLNFKQACEAFKGRDQPLSSLPFSFLPFLSGAAWPAPFLKRLRARKRTKPVHLFAAFGEFSDFFACQGRKRFSKRLDLKVRREGKTLSKEPLIKSRCNQLDAKKWWNHFLESHKKHSFNRKSEFSLFVLFGALAPQEPTGST